MGSVGLSQIIDAFVSALVVVGDPTNLALIIIAVLFGMVIGIIPGLGGVVTLALLIPITFGFDPLVAFMFLTAALGAVNFGGSLTAILINTPGTPMNAATILDGYPMTRNGEGGRAISVSAFASAFGAVFGVLVFLLVLPLLLRIIVIFGPPEIFWLGIWGLTIIAVIVKGDMISGLISAGIGLLLAMHGLNSSTARPRWTYGYVEMMDGVKLVPVIIGLFAVAEMMKLLSEGGSISKEKVDVQGGKIRGLVDVLGHKYLFFRSAVTGAVIGLIPGVGGTVANYISYFNAMQTEAESESFGTGDVRGLIASESSNDAKDGTALLPTLGLGIPGSASMAVLLGAFSLHGIQPGPTLVEENLNVVILIIVTLVISNFFTSAIGIAASDKLAVVSQIDVLLVAPIVLCAGLVGTYAVSHTFFDLSIAILFGLVGYVMITINMSRVPLILALVLGPIVETNFFRSLQISRGDFSYFVDSYVSMLLMVLVIASLFLPHIRPYVRERVLA